MKHVPGLRPGNFSQGTASLSFGEWFRIQPLSAGTCQYNHLGCTSTYVDKHT